MGELGESHAEPLIPAGETAQVPIRLIARYTRLKLAVGNEVHQLRENHPALIHSLTLGDCNSNRFERIARQSNEK
jgi:hypothetical protein